MQTKQCSVCKNSLDVIHFHKSKHSSDGYGWRCKPCQKNYDKDRFINNDRKRILNAKYKRSIRDKVHSLKTKCYYCQENDPVALDFHHLDRKTKKFTISESYHKKSWKEVLEEIAKCSVVCANCHRKLEAGRQLTVDEANIG